MYNLKKMHLFLRLFMYNYLESDKKIAVDDAGRYIDSHQIREVQLVAMFPRFVDFNPHFTFGKSRFLINEETQIKYKGDCHDSRFHHPI